MDEVMPFLIPITAIVMGLLVPIVYTIMDYRRRRDIVEAHHRERMAAIERGMELPPLPESFYQPTQKARRPRTQLLTGLILLFIGIALFVSLAGVAGFNIGLFGLIPGGIGLAYLIYYMVEGRKEQDEIDRKAAAARANVG